MVGKVLFITSNSKFPIKDENRIWNPVEVVGGFILADTDEAQALLTSLKLEFESIPNDEILRYVYTYDDETGDLISKEFPNANKDDYYNLEDGESFYEKTLKVLNPLNWFK